MQIYVCFADKGADPQGGGFVLAADKDEAIDWTTYFKAADLKVVWTDKRGAVL